MFINCKAALFEILNNKNISIDEFLSFLRRNIKIKGGGNFKIRVPSQYSPSDIISLDPDPVYSSSSYSINLNADKNGSINTIKLKNIGETDGKLLINIIASSQCPLFFSYEISSPIFFIWAMIISMIRLYTVIKIQNDSKNVVLHLEYLFEIYKIEFK